MKSSPTRAPVDKRQNGAALLLVLILLVLVGMIAVSGAEDSQLQMRMSANSQAYEQAYYNAETLLTLAEKKLQDGDYPLTNFNNEDGLFLLDNGTASVLTSSASLDVVLENQGIVATGGGGNARGFYLIEYLGKVGAAALNPTNEGNALAPRLDAFRITALGQAGTNDKAWAVVQSELRL
ncbi:pilus assembly PilX family protein [Pistricoccus aurantiacus]|uniref:pilus assembly PilX family protein n=1 Tax=Pistricoccus aurantiacus TaxID=1883414 RepID=UPI0036275665